jgi:CheY-like chemotaxis protein
LPLLVEADPVRLEQILTNLLNNAAKYTDPGGRLKLTAELEDGQALVRVRDNGLGISADLLPHVFDLFTQGTRLLDRSQGGLGIGLTLVKKLVELHGGTVQAFSAGPGQGSEFVVRLRPLSQGRRPGPSTASAGAVPAPRSLRLLVVDDNIDAAESLAMLLRLEGHCVRTAYDGPAAVQAAREELPEVMLLDIGLPGFDGFQVAQQLREQVRLGQVILVAVTGYCQEEDRRESELAGFHCHLVKPVDPVALRQQLADATKILVQ